MTLELYVNRNVFSSFSTIGEMLVETAHQCFTMEPVWRTDNLRPRAIGEGRFPLKRRWSQEHGRDVPGVENVPGFSDVEVHWGNFPKDTKACTLVGKTKGPVPDFIGSSKVAFDELFEKVLVPAWERGDEVWITYRNGSDEQFKAQLAAYMAQFNEGGIEAETPLFFHDNGAINRARTLEMPCYSGFTYSGIPTA